MTGLINYIKKAFKNYPDTTTRISAENLNHLDNGIYDLDQQLGTSLVAEDDLKFNFSKSGNKYGYKDSNGNFIPFDRVQASKTVTASTSTQTVTPDTEYSGIASVIINPQQHTGTRATVTSNGTVDLGEKHNTRYVPVNVIGSTPSEFVAVCRIPGATWTQCYIVHNGSIYDAQNNGSGLTGTYFTITPTAITARYAGTYMTTSGPKTVSAGDTLLSFSSESTHLHAAWTI